MGCGSCSSCCITLDVFEPNWYATKPFWFHKIAGEKCEHLCNEGCSIYEDRPSVCEVYSCLWLEFDGKNESLRPDNLGVLLHPQSDDNRCLAIEVVPGAMEDPKVQLWFNCLRENGFTIETE